jgi:hypothetical protein
MRTTYKGYAFTDLTTQTDDGRYKARAAIMALEGSRTRSQRFLDLETFKTLAEANARVLAGAMAWIDANLGDDRLALPSSFVPLD